MQKDFNKWNEQKIEIHNRNENKLYHAREIWWCSLGVNIGSEQNGHGESFERPVIVIRKYTSDTFLCIPLTTKEKSGNYYYKMGDNLESISYAILSQAKVLDRKRLRRLVGTVSYKELHDIVEKYKGLI